MQVRDGVAILFLLLRFLTTPAPVVPAAAVLTDADALRDARSHMATIEAGPGRITDYMRGAQNGPLRMSCVAQRLQESQVHVTLAHDEMQVLATVEGGAAAGDHGRDSDRAHAVKRLALMAQRTQEVEREAHRCVDDELQHGERDQVRGGRAARGRAARRRHRGPPNGAHPCPGTTASSFPGRPTRRDRAVLPPHALHALVRQREAALGARVPGSSLSASS